MKTFKTPKGTLLPLIDLKGKDYLNAQYRVVWFREEHPLGRIETDRLSEAPNQVTYRATVWVDGQILANADKTLVVKVPTDYEKCETMAIGRALALCGYGTQFAAADLDEGDDVSDSPVDRSQAVKQSRVTPSAPLPSHTPADSFPASPPTFDQGEEIPTFEELPSERPTVKWAKAAKQLADTEKTGPTTPPSPSTTIKGGKFNGLTLQEALKQDSKEDHFRRRYGYATWIDKELKKPGAVDDWNKKSPSLVEYWRYAKANGALEELPF